MFIKWRKLPRCAYILSLSLSLRVSNNVLADGRARMKAKYDWDVDGVMSQGDAALGTSKEDAQIYISTRQDFTMSHVTIAGELFDLLKKHSQSSHISTSTINKLLVR